MRHIAGDPRQTALFSGLTFDLAAHFKAFPFVSLLFGNQATHEGLDFGLLV